MRPLFDGHDRIALSPLPADPKVITSRQNPFIEDLRHVRDDPPDKFIFLEGPKLLEEALKSNLTIEELVYVPEIFNTELIQTAAALARQKTQVTAYVLKGLSDVEAPQGVVAIAHKPLTDWSRIFAESSKPIVILDGIQNAGNAATIVRTAEAAGVAGIITTPKSARLFSPKALRGAMGSSLRVPILEHQSISAIAEKLSAAGYGILSTVSPSQSSRSYMDVDWGKAWAIVLGQEGNGLSEEWRDKNPCAVHIPMEAAVESLNVAAAAAILLYEARRKK